MNKNEFTTGDVKEVFSTAFSSIDITSCTALTQLNVGLRVGGNALKIGDKITLILPNDLRGFINDLLYGRKVGNNVWIPFPTREGYQLSLSKLLRHGNGLPLTGFNALDRLISLLTLIALFGGELRLTVDKIVQGHRKFIDSNGCPVTPEYPVFLCPAIPDNPKEIDLTAWKNVLKADEDKSIDDK